MAEKHRNPRINLTIPSNAHDVLVGYAEMLDKPLSTAVRELIIEMIPSMKMSIEAYKLAETDKDKALNKLYEGLIEGVSNATQLSIMKDMKFKS